MNLPAVGDQPQAIFYLGDALKYFFNHAEINIYQGNININLMNFFPLLKQGFTTKEMSWNVLVIYMIDNGLAHPTELYRYIPDNLINKVFNNGIPALIYADGNITMLMEDAVKSKIIPEPMNTYEVFKNLNDTFDPAQFGMMTVEQMLDVNGVDLDRTQYPEHYLNSNLITGLSRELSLIRGISATFYEFVVKLLDLDPDANPDILGRITLKDFIITAKEIQTELQIHQIEIDDVINNLILDPWIHLLYAIIIQDANLVRRTIKEIDPQKNNNEAYRLALEMGGPEISDIIRKYITHELWAQREFARHMIEPITGPSVIPESLFKYSQK